MDAHTWKEICAYRWPATQLMTQSSAIDHSGLFKMLSEPRKCFNVREDPYGENPDVDPAEPVGAELIVMDEVNRVKTNMAAQIKAHYTLKG